MTTEKSFLFGNIRIRVHFLSVISLVAMFLAENGIYTVAVLFCAAFHEAGHIAAIKLLRGRVTEFAFLPFGAEIKAEMHAGYKEDMMVAIAGPAFNLMLCGISFAVFCFFKHPLIVFVGICSFFLAVLNLIPIRSFDGAKILRSIAFSYMKYEKALKAVRFSELFSLIILSLLSVLAVLFCKGNISLAVICVYIFVSVYKNSF